MIKKNSYTNCQNKIKPQKKIEQPISVGSDQIRSDQSLSRVQLFATPWIAARQACLSITNSRSSLTSIESVMPSSHLILCRPLLLLRPIPPSIRVFSNESTLRMRWPKYWSFSFSIIQAMCRVWWEPRREEEGIQEGGNRPLSRQRAPGRKDRGQKAQESRQHASSLYL